MLKYSLIALLQTLWESIQLLFHFCGACKITPSQCSKHKCQPEEVAVRCRYPFFDGLVTVAGHFWTVLYESFDVLLDLSLLHMNRPCFGRRREVLKVRLNSARPKPFDNA